MSAKDNGPVSRIDSLLEDIGRQPGKDRRALAQLLDNESRKEGSVFALRSEMGFALADTKNQAAVPSFTVVRDLNWIGKNVRMMGSGMPFLLQQVGESISESVKHRAPDYTRQPAISAYLARDKRRKFGPLLAVIAPAWIDDPKHANWGFDRRATKSAHAFEELDSQGQVGLLDLNDVQLYALDGQHRVMGIQGLQELQEMGFLQIRERDGKRGAERLSWKDFMARFELGSKELQELLNESISIELIPAILEGETARQGAERLRSVFHTINATSRRTGQGKTKGSDETNGFAIVARKAAALHKLFADERVNMKTATLPRRSKWYTTLEALKDMATEYLVQVKPGLAERWNPEYPAPKYPVHPKEKEIEEGRKSFFEFLDYMEKLPIFSYLESHEDEAKKEHGLKPSGNSILVNYSYSQSGLMQMEYTEEIPAEELDAPKRYYDSLKPKNLISTARPNVIDRKRFFPGFEPDWPDDGNGHLLMRPTGQVILAKAVGILVSKGEALEDIFRKLKNLDNANGFAQHLPQNRWYGVTYDFAKKKMKTRVPDWAHKLLVYQKEERDQLLWDVMKARWCGEPEIEKWHDFTPAGEEENAQTRIDNILGEEKPKAVKYNFDVNFDSLGAPDFPEEPPAPLRDLTSEQLPPSLAQQDS